jgi:hypothetical protein
MTLAAAQLALVLLILSIPAHGQPSQCPALLHIDGSRGSASECRCGTDLKSVTLTPPKGFTLKAACDLRKWNEADGVFVNIPAQRAVNLDRYDQYDNASIGRYYFQGHIRMNGLLRFEPSDGGDLFFVPAQPVQMPESTIEPYFRSFHLIPLGQDSTFNVTKSLRTMGCAEARAEIVIHDVMVIANDSEEAGAYPRRVEALRISSYKPCNRN